MKDEPKTLIGIRLRKKTKRDLKQAILLLLGMAAILGVAWKLDQWACENRVCLKDKG